MRFTDCVRAVMAHEDLAARQWVKDAKRVGFAIDWAPPEGGPVELAVAAGVAELLCVRHGLPVPPWVAAVGPAAEKIFLTAEDRPSYRAHLEAVAPPVLRSRNVYASPAYLAVL